jgi:hypothetical protein
VRREDVGDAQREPARRRHVEELVRAVCVRAGAEDAGDAELRLRELSTRCFGIWVESASSFTTPVCESSIRSSSWRITRSLAAITPVPSPECTPSVSSETSRVPITSPRSDVVDHSWS